jgi:hypothetical protein
VLAVSASATVVFRGGTSLNQSYGRFAIGCAFSVGCRVCMGRDWRFALPVDFVACVSHRRFFVVRLCGSGSACRVAIAGFSFGDLRWLLKVAAHAHEALAEEVPSAPFVGVSRGGIV